MTVRVRLRMSRLCCVALVFVLVGCGDHNRDNAPAPAATQPVGQTDLRQAPPLKRQVENGALPPLAQRLPDEPVRVHTFGDAARYGGTLRTIIASYWDYGGLDTVHSCRLLRHVPRVDDDGKIVTDKDGKILYELVGNLAKDWQYDDTGRRITMTLRRGIHYSDGHAFTAEDVKYRWRLWNDTERYGKISPIPVQRLGGEPIKLEKLGKYRFRFILPEADRRWLEDEATQLQFWEAPKHWLKQWDPHLAEDGGDWSEFRRRLGDWQDATRPSLGAWQIVKWESTGEVIAERNPYYYMVDQAGRQLPYIHRIRGAVVTNQEVAAMKVTAGQVDLYDQARLQDVALLKANEARGNYTLRLHGEGVGSFPALFLNYFSSRGRLGHCFRKQQFRVALSIGIDREEINQLVFNGFGTPTNVSLGEWYTDRHATYQPQRAQTLLDEIGLKDRDQNGIREYPNGTSVTIVITTLSGTYASVCELVASHWRALGIDAVVNNAHPNQYSVTRSKRRYDVIAAHKGTFNLDKNLDMKSWSPLSAPIDLSQPPSQGPWEPFHRWIASNGQQGQKPPMNMRQDLKRLKTLYQQYRNETNPDRSRQLAKRISRIWADNVWSIGVVGRAPTPVVMGNALRNAPELVESPPEGYWLRAGLYPYQLVLAPR